MSYDEEKNSITPTPDGDPIQLRADLFQHMEAVSRKVLEEQASKKPKATLDKLQSLTKPVKACIVLMVLWFVYVIYRASSDHELLGIILERWRDDSLLLDLFLPPAVIVTLYKCVRWLIEDNKKS